MAKFRIYLLTIFLLLPTILMCQSSSAFGIAYRNCNDYKNDTPLYKTTFKFIPKDLSEYHAEYKVKSKNLKISQKKIKFGIWIIKNEESIYLNGSRQGLQCGFLKFNTGKKYYYFIAKPIYNASEQARINNSANFFGAPGSIVTTTKIDIENKNKLHHVLNLEEGTIHRLTKEYILSLLQDYPAILQDFENIENNSDIEVLKTYLEIVNGLQ